jgi:hypothetical protein
VPFAFAWGNKCDERRCALPAAGYGEEVGMSDEEILSKLLGLNQKQHTMQGSG